MRILQVLQHPLEEGQRLIEDHRHGYLGELLADAILQHRPEGEVAAAELSDGECGPGGK